MRNVEENEDANCCVSFAFKYIYRGYSSFWSEYEFYFIERSEIFLYFMSAEGTNEIYNFSLHEMK